MTWEYTSLPNTLYCSMVKWVWEKNVIGSWNVLSVISENYVFICVFCESLAGPGFAPVLGGIAIALLEVARFMVMRLIASIIIQGVPISFSSLPAATFYFITAIVKSELQFSRSGDIAIIIPLQTNWIRVGVVWHQIMAKWQKTWRHQNNNSCSSWDVSCPGSCETIKSFHASWN